jgi:hypothetical protein
VSKNQTRTEEIKKEFDDAMIVLNKLKGRGNNFSELIEKFKKQADKYGLWSEVCWSAKLRENMTLDELSEALYWACAEWDL